MEACDGRCQGANGARRTGRALFNIELESEPFMSPRIEEARGKWKPAADYTNARPKRFLRRQRGEAVPPDRVKSLRCWHCSGGKKLSLLGLETERSSYGCETSAVKIKHAQGVHGFEMLGGGVPLVRRETVTGVLLVEFCH